MLGISALNGHPKKQTKKNIRGDQGPRFDPPRKICETPTQKNDLKQKPSSGKTGRVRTQPEHVCKKNVRGPFKGVKRGLGLFNKVFNGFKAVKGVIVSEVFDVF